MRGEARGTRAPAGAAVGRALSYDPAMASGSDVTPNRRGLRSREVVLDAAERLMAEQGYEAATVAAIVERSGIPMSSVYHYFGSKDGVLLAVMERGAQRFFASLPDLAPPRPPARPQEHITRVVAAVGQALQEHPDFLRLLVVLAAQPPVGEESEVRAVVGRVRDVALGILRQQLGAVFAIEQDGEEARGLARFALAAFDGAFVAHQADPGVAIAEVLRPLPIALVAAHEQHGG